MEGLPDDFPENKYLAETEIRFKEKPLLKIKMFIDITFIGWITLKIFKNGENGKCQSINLLVIRGIMYWKGVCVKAGKSICEIKHYTDHTIKKKSVYYYLNNMI